MSKAFCMLSISLLVVAILSPADLAHRCLETGGRVWNPMFLDSE